MPKPPATPTSNPHLDQPAAPVAELDRVRRYVPGRDRNTPQRLALREAFQAAGRPMSPEEALLAAKQQVAGLSLATVYRNINALVEDKWLVAVEIPGSSPRYELAGKAHHHHFHCTTCTSTFELDGCAVAIEPKLPRGFRVSRHEYTLFGTCPNCK